MTQANTNSWKLAKGILDAMTFPVIENPPSPISGLESHGKGKTPHRMDTYYHNLKPINGFKVRAKWNRCNTCGEIRNSNLTIFDNMESVFHTKDFVKQGKDIETGFSSGKADRVPF